MGEPLCKRFCVLMNIIRFVFVMESLRLRKLVPSVPCFYPSIALFFILSFSHLSVRPVGCNLKSPGVARKAQLLVIVGIGGVRSVRNVEAKFM